MEIYSQPLLASLPPNCTSSSAIFFGTTRGIVAGETFDSRILHLSPRATFVKSITVMKLSLSLLLGALATSALAQDQNILETAAASGFATLVTAVNAAGLADTLNGDGPFTTFAPVNDAFAALPEQILDCLLEQSTALGDILLYHVIPDRVLSSDLTDGLTATTVNGNDLTFTVGDSITVNDATVTEADILATNGVIHIIDGRKYFILSMGPVWTI